MFKVSPKSMREIYMFLRTQAPFSRWDLPTENLKFTLIAAGVAAADYIFEGDTHCLRVSANLNGTLAQVLESVAHEMVHMRQELLGRLNTDNPHNAEFLRLAKQVCRNLGFDVQKF